LHGWAGYVAVALIAVRAVWGIVGTRYARVGQFVRGPRTMLAYMGEVLRHREARYIGHDPAGTAMVLAILITITARPAQAG
jgi:cytochrome b